MEKQPIPLSQIFFKLAVLHARIELDSEYPDYKETPSPATAKDINPQANKPAKRRKIKRHASKNSKKKKAK